MTNTSTTSITPTTTTTTTTTAKLTKAMLHNDISKFRSPNFEASWPKISSNSLNYEQLLHKAFKLGRKRIASLLLEKSNLASSSNQNVYDALLHTAVKKYGRSSTWCDVIVSLVDKLGAKVESRDEKGNTAVHLAFVSFAGERLVDLLLKRYGGSEDVVNEDGLSLLHIACARSDLELIERLCCGGSKVDVNCQISVTSESIHAGYSPLHFAVEYRRLNVAKYLLEEKADVYVQNANGSTPLHEACYRRDVEMIDLLHSYDRVNRNVVDNFGLTHFMTACAGTDVVLAEKYLLIAEIRSEASLSSLINNQVKDLDTFPYSGYTPLHFATDFGRLETVKLLLKSVANCCPATSDGLTPLVLAKELEHDEIYSYLARSCRHKNMNTRNVVEPEKKALDINFNKLSFSSKFDSSFCTDVSLNDSIAMTSSVNCDSDAF